MARFAAYYSYHNEVALTAYAHVGSFHTIEDAYFYLFDNHDRYAASPDINGKMKHPKLLTIDCFVKEGGKRVYLDSAQFDRVRKRLEAKGNMSFSRRQPLNG
jgi:hypothetical protein